MNIEVQIVVAILMLIGNAFFVGAEFGLVSSRRSSIELQAQKGSKGARITLGAMERVSLMLAGAQLGVTLCSLIFGAIGEPLFAHFLERPLGEIGLPHEFLHPVSLATALVVMVYMHVVLGEMVPKNLALAGPTRAAIWLTPPLVVFVRMTRPIVIVLNATANLTIRLFGLTPRQEMVSSFSRDEVAGFVKESHREGLLSSDEEHLLSGALNFDQKSVRSVLLPRDKLVIITEGTRIAEVEKVAATTGFSRFPVADSKGELTGYVHIKDILTLTSDEATKLSIQQARRLPEVKVATSLRKTLIVMQRAGAHLAKVIDTDGVTQGVVALEDVLEELVGTIRDDAQRLHGRGSAR